MPGHLQPGTGVCCTAAEVTAPAWGQEPPSSLDLISPACSARDIAARGAGVGGDTGSELGWDVGGGRGRGSGMTGDIFGVGEHKRFKPALSACYKPAISRAEIWQSVNNRLKNNLEK